MALDQAASSFSPFSVPSWLCEIIRPEAIRHHEQCAQPSKLLMG
jgi:hypothetical protein